jgi:DNA-binding transcriptional ArsR family regulator
MADIFGVLADSTRRDILAHLAHAARSGTGPTPVPELVEALGAVRQSVNRHLTVLAEAGLVTVVDDGPERSYALDATPLEEVEEWLVPFLALAPTDGATTAFTAWSGADLGESIGRATAERYFKARSAIRGASQSVTSLTGRLPLRVTRRSIRGK